MQKNKKNKTAFCIGHWLLRSLNMGNDPWKTHTGRLLENSNTLSFYSVLGTWRWLDKTVMDYTNWALDEPENDYGEMNAADGTWTTGRRWHDRGYICKTPKGKMVTSM